MRAFILTVSILACSALSINAQVIAPIPRPADIPPTCVIDTSWPGDFNGDGLRDVLCEWHDAESNKTYFSVYNYSLGTTSKSISISVSDFYSGNDDAYAVDLDGDGADEFVYRGHILEFGIIIGTNRTFLQKNR
ncbi:MAG: hypothetical protein GF344_09560 [Chitinivibrionales bacterium]|nr:hypothetical protein [Chitinivibrionales bacterium]MBD3357088.1 hypothetical protein [Chitinivibrionales bacterium]